MVLLKNLALGYWREGWNVIPVGADKRPIIKEWKPWREQRQTQQDVESMPWDKATGVAGLTGLWFTENLSAIDVDVESLEKAKEFLETFPETRKHITPSGGFHLLYKSRKPVGKIDRFKKLFGIEVKGLGAYIILPGSFNEQYAIENPLTPIAEVEDLEAMIYERAKQLGWKETEKVEGITYEQLKVFDFWQIPCISFFKDNPFPEGERELTIGKNFCILLKAQNLDDDQLKEVCKILAENQPDFSYIDIYGWRRWVESEPREFNCGEVSSYIKRHYPNFSCGKCPIKEKLKPKKVSEDADEKQKIKTKKLAAGFLENGCFESIIYNGEPCFLVYNNGNFEIKPEIILNGNLKIEPLEPEETPYPPYEVFEGDVNLEELYMEIYREFDRFIDVEEHWKHFFTTCVLLTYKQDKIRTISYLYLVGDNESGKTMVLDVFYFLAYRPMKGTSFPAADIYTYLETEPPGCILEDELGNVKKDPEKMKIYKAGYKKPGIVPRIMTSPITGKRTIKYYNVFCFKAVTNEKLIEDKGSMDRFEICQMVEGFPEKDEITDEDVEKFKQLRNKLLKWKMQTWNQPLPEIPLEIKGRLKEHWKPILQMAFGLPGFEKLKEYVDKLISEKKAEKEESFEGKLTKVVWELYQNNGEKIKFTDIWERLTQELNGRIDDKKPNQMETDEHGTITKNMVGYRLREILGGKKTVIKDSERKKSVKAYEFNFEKLERAAKKYHVYQVTKSTKFGEEDTEKTTPKKESFEEKTPKKASLEEPFFEKLGRLGNSVDNLQPTLLERLEAYVKQHEGDVGRLKIQQDLGLTEDQLKSLVATSKNLVWGPTGETIKWKPKEEA
jgi:hypothetical protein